MVFKDTNFAVTYWSALEILTQLWFRFFQSEISFNALVNIYFI